MTSQASDRSRNLLECRDRSQGQRCRRTAGGGRYQRAAARQAV